jgi:hypothetical protein
MYLQVLFLKVKKFVLTELPTFAREKHPAIHFGQKPSGFGDVGDKETWGRGEGGRQE